MKLRSCSLFVIDEHISYTCTLTGGGVIIASALYKCSLNNNNSNNIYIDVMCIGLLYHSFLKHSSEKRWTTRHRLFTVLQGRWVHPDNQDIPDQRAALAIQAKLVTTVNQVCREFQDRKATKVTLDQSDLLEIQAIRVLRAWKDFRVYQENQACLEKEYVLCWFCASFVTTAFLNSN